MNVTPRIVTYMIMAQGYMYVHLVYFPSIIILYGFQITITCIFFFLFTQCLRKFTMSMPMFNLIFFLFHILCVILCKFIHDVKPLNAYRNGSRVSM